MQRVPTLKEVMRSLEIQTASLGLLSYPVLQAADILMVRSHLVPVGKDQASHIEVTREIAQRFNLLYGDVFPVPDALIGDVPTLPGTDGKAKMSKSQGNALLLSASPDEIRRAVHLMYTDPNHLRVSDPGTVEGNVVFTYLDAFDPDEEGVADLKEQYQRGGLGDKVVKARLETLLQALLAPIRERRAALAHDPDTVLDVLRDGTAKARAITQTTLEEVREGLGLFRF